jgi:KaiC/GvpD/RAD55 family RecA-like ATPase
MGNAKPDPAGAYGGQVAKDVEPEQVEWLWPLEAVKDAEQGRIPRSMLSVVAGRADQGKGLFAVRVASDVSRSGQNVLYSAIEDSPAIMTRPRLEAAGADLAGEEAARKAVPDILAALHRQKKDSAA